MPDIVCPNCGTVFSVDDTTYASISKQVRDKEFDKELKAQKAAAVKLVEMEKDQVIASLQAQVDGFHTELALAIRRAVDEKQQELSDKDREIIGLQAKLDNQKQAADAEKEAAVHLAEAQKDKTLAELQGQLATMESEHARKEEGQGCLLTASCHCQAPPAGRSSWTGRAGARRGRRRSWSW